MDATEQVGARKVTFIDVLRALPRLAPDGLRMARGAVELVTLKPTNKESIGHIFQRAAARHPQRPFVRFEDVELTYGQANSLVNRYA
ncbi:MAG TPA: hypothetical protein VM677_04190, partial [Actinokineospora sp.]|nr:hypothetical protein [Actinokineospora sp.]